MRTRLLALALLAGATGCTSHVEWLPDSSGFLYSRVDGKVARYTLESKQSQTLLQTPVADFFPAYDLHPDGKRIALVESHTVGDDTPTVESRLRFFDLDGKELAASDTLTWQPTDDDYDERKPILSWCGWSPQGKTLALTVGAQGVATYDTRQKQFQVVEGASFVMPGLLGTSIWRPDGGGFLAGKTEPGQDDIALFVTPDGKAREMTVRDPQNLKAQAADNPVSARWKGKTAIIDLDSVQLRIDTENLLARYEKSTPREGDQNVLARAQVGGTRYRTRKFEQNDQEHIVVERFADGAWHTIEPEGTDAAFSMSQRSLVVAPDGKHAVVVGKSRLTLVDADGVVDRIPVGEPPRR